MKGFDQAKSFGVQCLARNFWPRDFWRVATLLWIGGIGTVSIVLLQIKLCTLVLLYFCTLMLTLSSGPQLQN